MRTLVLLTLLVAACGYTGQDAFTGARHPDGVSAWQDLGALELCLANERIGPAGSAAGGFCVDVNTPNEQICADDSRCASRERCVCGRCTVAFCSSNSECPAGSACNFGEKRCAAECNSNAECKGAGEVCAGGFCKGQCGSDADCQTAEVCSSQGRCIVAACAGTSDCLAGEICKVQRQPRATAQPSVLAGDAAHGHASGRGRFVMWFEMASLAGTTRAIFRAVSEDGSNFQLDPADPVLEDAGDARAPSVAATPEGGLVMYYETAAGIRRAASNDGVSFDAAETVVAGDFHAPAAAFDADGAPLVYLQRGDRAGLALWRGSGAPVDVFGSGDATLPELWKDVTRVGSPAVLVDTDDGGLGLPAVRVWFDAFGAESGDSIQFGQVVPLPPNDSIGYCSAPLDDPAELVSYPYNPVFDRVVAFLDHRAEVAPAVVRDPDGEVYFLYYGASSADGMTQEGLGVARNPPQVPPP
jgi:hypothetical protein